MLHVIGTASWMIQGADHEIEGTRCPTSETSLQPSGRLELTETGGLTTSQIGSDG